MEENDGWDTVCRRDILRQFPALEIYDLGGEGDISQCDMSLLRVIASHPTLRTATISSLNTARLGPKGLQPPRVPSNFSKIVIQDMFLGEDSDLPVVAGWLKTKARVRNLLVMPSQQTPGGLAPKWVEHTYPALKKLSYLNTVEHLSDEILYGEFLPRHPDLESFELSVVNGMIEALPLDTPVFRSLHDIFMGYIPLLGTIELSMKKTNKKLFDCTSFGVNFVQASAENSSSGSWFIAKMGNWLNSIESFHINFKELAHDAGRDFALVRLCFCS